MNSVHACVHLSVISVSCGTVSCGIGEERGYPDWTYCQTCKKHSEFRTGYGTRLRRLSHATLDGLEHAIRAFSRSRRHLGWIEKVKACGGCGGRERWINRHVRPDFWWRRAVGLSRKYINA